MEKEINKTSKYDKLIDIRIPEEELGELVQHDILSKAITSKLTQIPKK